MLIIPAIDIRDGKCVRLIQGKADAETIFDDDPVSVAIKWQDNGAQLLHIVDLDGAFTGIQKNLNIVRQIAGAISIPIEIGGGIRDLTALENVYQAGVQRAILGTSALNTPEFVGEMCQKYGDRIAVGIDARDGIVAIKGWTETGEKTVVSLA